MNPLVASVCGAAALLPLALGMLLAFEGLHLALASQATLDEYHFGSEAMLGHGGWHYRSQTTYVWSALLQAAVLLTSALLLSLGARRRSWPLAASGVVVGVAFLTYNQLVMPLA